MRVATTCAVIFLTVSLSACSVFGKGGKGASDGEFGAEGNLPFASADGVLKDIYFDYDSSTIDGASREVLRTNAEWLQENRSATVMVEGHCDERGTAEYNLALGERRARSVYDFMRSAGVEASRMKTISYGEELPLDPSGTESAWSKNRRAHFAVNQ